MAIKDKIINCIAINMAKERYGDSNKSDSLLIEAELTFKNLLLNVLIERSKGDPLKYIECLENFEEICGWDYYDVWFLESFVFGEWSRDI